MAIWPALTITVVGFILTGIVGTWITYFWQTQNWRRQQLYLRNKEKSDKQIEITRSLSYLIDRRRFRMLRAYYAIRNKNKERVVEEWKKYDDIIFEWNDNLNGYITSIRHFFGKEFQSYFEYHIVPEFYRIGEIIEGEKRAFDTEENRINLEKFNSIKGRLNYLSHNTNLYLKQLWDENEKMRSIIDEKPKISFENASSLSYWYIFKQIFAFRSNL